MRFGNNKHNNHGGNNNMHSNSYHNSNTNNMLNANNIAPRFKRTLMSTTQNTVDDIQMRPSVNSLLFKANMNIKSSQLPLQPTTHAKNSNNNQATSYHSGSNAVDNLIPSFNSSAQINQNSKQNYQPQQFQNNQASSAMSHPSNNNINKPLNSHNQNPHSQQTQSSNQNSPSNMHGQSQSSNQLQTDQQAKDSKQANKQKKDKGPSKDEILKKVAQFLSETLLEKGFLEHQQKIREKEQLGENETIDVENNNKNGEIELNNSAEEDNEITSQKNIETLDDAIKLFNELKVPEKFIKDSIGKIINESLDKNDLVHEIIIEFLVLLRKENRLTNNQMLDAFRTVINGMNEKEKTIPKVTTLVASMFARAINKKLCKLSDVSHYTDNGQHYPLFLLVLQQLHKLIGKQQLTEMFNASKINLKNSLLECDRSKERMAEILDDRNLNFLYPLLRVESELWKQITQSDSQPTTFYKWIKDNVDSARYGDSGFIVALMTVLLKYITKVSASF